MKTNLPENSILNFLPDYICPETTWGLAPYSWVRTDTSIASAIQFRLINDPGRNFKSVIHVSLRESHSGNQDQRIARSPTLPAITPSELTAHKQTSLDGVVVSVSCRGFEGYRRVHDWTRRNDLVTEFSLWTIKWSWHSCFRLYPCPHWSMDSKRLQKIL